MIEEILLSLAQGIWILTFCLVLCFWMEKKADREEKEWLEEEKRKLGFAEGRRRRP